MKNVIASIVLVLLMSACGSQEYRLVTGPRGEQGLAGTNGSSCSVSSVTDTSIAPNGGSLITCGDGSSSLVLNGSKGDTGAVGAAGSTGASGTPGTVVTPIQFCGAATSYPNTFTESGFCIADQVYGVYSANDGFLALLPPGTYTSNGINSSCTFTIGSNCSVTH